MSTVKPSRFLPAPKHFADMEFFKRAHQRLNALSNIQIVDEHGNFIGTANVTEGNIVFQITVAQGNNVVIAQWQPQAWAKNAIVFFVPDGAPAATYYAVIDVPAVDPNTGLPIPPDTGSPYWGKFPSAAPGQWL